MKGLGTVFFAVVFSSDHLGLKRLHQRRFERGPPATTDRWLTGLMRVHYFLHELPLGLDALRPW